MNATQRYSLRTIAILIMVLCSILLALTVQGQSPEPISYTSFEGDILTLYPYSGEHVAILVPNLSYDESVLNNMVFVYDDAYSFYQQATGKQPSLYINHNGLSTIAVVPKTCGYACGYLGATGIEITNYGFDDTNYPQAALSKYDQTLFYELGRNFWFYSDQIEYKSTDEGSAIVTGYAVYMRFKAMDATGVTPAPYNGIPFSDFRSEVEGLLNTYLANPTFNWSNTLRVNQGVPNSMGLGGTDLFASFMFELDDMFGQDFVMGIWQEVEQRPNALTTQDAVDNFIIAASMTADTNLEGLFTTDWRWPISQQARQELLRHFGGTPPGADFGATPRSGIAPLAVQFTDNSTGSVDTWLWEFGDGDTSPLQYPKHTYNAGGTYAVTLTVSGSGGSNTKTRNDYITVIENPNPEIDTFIYLPIILEPSVAPLPSGQATILDGFTNYEESGFQFSSNSVVAWDSNAADLLAAKAQSSSPMSFFLPYDAPPYDNPDIDEDARSGIIGMPQPELEQVSECPESGYEYHWVEASSSGVYCVRTRDGQHYAKIKLTSIGNVSLSFTWVYQPDGSRKFH